MLMKTEGLEVEGEADTLFGTYEDYMEWLYTHQDEHLIGCHPAHCVLAHYLAARHHVGSLSVSVGSTEASVFPSGFFQRDRRGHLPFWALKERWAFDSFACGQPSEQVTVRAYLKSRGLGGRT